MALVCDICGSKQGVRKIEVRIKNPQASGNVKLTIVGAPDLCDGCMREGSLSVTWSDNSQTSCRSGISASMKVGAVVNEER